MDDEVQAAYRRARDRDGRRAAVAGQARRRPRACTPRRKSSAHFIPSQVRAARLGAYPDSLQEYLDAGNTGAALDLVDKWDEKFPTDKPNGHSFFWRGKVLTARGQPADAVRYLDRAIRLTTGAPFETEARWLLAEALDQLGRKDEAKRELAKLVAVGVNDEFTKKAIEKLKKDERPRPCESCLCVSADAWSAARAGGLSVDRRWRRSRTKPKPPTSRP